MNDIPDNNASVNKFSNFMFIEGFIPSHNLYWSSEALYRHSEDMLVPIKTVAGTAYIRQVLVSAGKIWMLINSHAGGEVVVLDLKSSKELDNISYNSRPELAWSIDEIAVNREGHIMLKQYDFLTNDYLISHWNNQKWTVFSRSAGTFPATIRTVTTSPSGEFFVLTGGTSTGIYKYKTTGWENLADVPVGNLADNLYPDLNNNIWLTGTYGIARLSLADFDLASVDKTDYCRTDTVTAVVTANGKVNLQKPLTAIFELSTGGSIHVEGLMAVNNQVRIQIPDALAGSEVSLQLRATEPVMLTKTKRKLSIHPVPTATITADKTSMLPGKDTALVGITLTGASPWTFKLWDNQPVSAESATYSRKFVLTQPADFELKISELMDKYCKTGTVKNSVRIIANVVTGTEPVSSAVSVYPNPITDQLIVRYENYTGKTHEYFISDARGTLVSSLKIDRSVNEWDIRSLPAGIYVLWTVQNGSKRSCKIVKN